MRLILFLAVLNLCIVSLCNNNVCLYAEEFPSDPYETGDTSEWLDKAVNQEHDYIESDGSDADPMPMDSPSYEPTKDPLSDIPDSPEIEPPNNEY